MEPLRREFEKACNQLRDRDEVLMALFLSVTRFNSAKLFQSILVRNNSFKELQPDWYLLFQEKNIFSKLQQFTTSVERCHFNFIVLK